MDGSPKETHLDLLALPEELRSAGRELVKSLEAGSGVSHAFSTFCSRSYVKPDWAGAASEFLAELFDEQQDLLADMTRIPDMIIELASGHLTLTCMVAYRWAARSETAQLAKLAEALAATQSKTANAEVVHIMLALVTSLAITRYPRAEHMMTVAEPQAGDEHLEGLEEARLWLAAGRVVRSCSQESRDLWDHRLRRKRTVWSWDNTLECKALHELADQMKPDREGLALFEAVVPAAWWQLAQVRGRETAEADVKKTDSEAALKEAQNSAQESISEALEMMETARAEVATSAAQATAAISAAESMVAAAPAMREELESHSAFLLNAPHDSFSQLPLAPQIVVWNAWPFGLGWLLGAAAVAISIWIHPYELRKPEPAAVIAAVPVPQAPEAVQAAPTPEPPQEMWRRSEAAKVAAEAGDLNLLFARIHKGTWAENETLLSGESAELTKDDPRYVKLLAWLHLDPPTDQETLSRIPALLAEIRADSDTLDLWKQLTYRGSPLLEVLQKTASRQIHESKDGSKIGTWSATQLEALSRISWGVDL